MKDKQPKTGKRIQIYLAARHADWWQKIPRYDRSRIVAEALDLYRRSEHSGADRGAAQREEKENNAV